MDAISIDQGNLLERAIQVRIMDKIFTTAIRVIVHLGEETAGSQILFEELAEADKLLVRGQKCDRPSPSNIIVQELNSLFQRPWFKRVWVLQEVYLKDDIIFMCGSASASSDALIKLCFGYQKRTLVTKSLRPFALSLVYYRLEQFPTLQFNLWDRLFKSREYLATDPRDRVFALKSLIDFRQQELDPLIDYNKSIEEIFIEIAMFLLPVLGLRILTAVRHPHQRDMPSWIPDRSQNLPLSRIFSQDFDFSNIGEYGKDLPKLKPFDERKHEVRWTSDGNNSCLELIVQGCQYAQIVHRSHIFSFLSLDDARVQMERLYYSFENLREIVDLSGMEDVCAMHDQLGQEITDGAYEGYTV
jgi:hypothetical protein